MTNCPRPGRLHLWLTSAIAALVLAGGAIYWLNRSPREDRPVTPSDSIGDGHDWFIDKTATAELDFTYRNGEEADRFTILETLGGGVALLDYDGDGLLDIFVTGGGFFDGPEKKQLHGYPCKLYKNLGNWRFKDVTADVGFDKVKWWYTHGASVADYDCDGWPDLLVTGYGHLALFRNVADGEGRRRFVDVTDAVGLRDDSWSTSAGWADLDGDGFPDLYVCHYVDWSFDNDPLCKGYSLGVKRDTCSPERFKPLVHALFRNEK